MVTMKRMALGLIAFAIISSSLPLSGQGTDASGAKGELQVAQANNAFAVELYGKLASEPGNLLISPYSIETALAMTYAGARGRTAEEMAKVLRLWSKEEGIHEAFGNFVRELNAEKTPDGRPRGYQLSVANALWGQKGYSFLPAFLNLVKRHYGAGLNEVDFKTDAEGARQTINNWAARETREKIKDIIPAGALHQMTYLVLTNAIYFKGNWAAQFKPADTRPAPFHIAPGQAVKVAMMNREGHYGYMQDKTCQVLKMPYVGEELAMIVFLPRKRDGLADLEASLEEGKISEWLDALREEAISLAFPRFTVGSMFELSKVLAAMGMPAAFPGGSPDFSGMDGTRDLFISDVFHKTFAEVTEEGTEAAAVTVVHMAKEGAGIRMYRFQADHPFIFIIRHEKSGAILFLGRLSNPGGAVESVPDEEEKQWKK